MKLSVNYFIIVFSLFLCTSIKGQGILFSQYRMILNPGEIRSLQVCNPTDMVRTYQLSFIDKKMENGGKVVDIPDSVNYPFSLKGQLRIFPKRITLNPGECQEVQIQLKNTSSLQDGEYRSFLHFLPLVDSEVVSIDTSNIAKAPVPAIILRIGAAIPLFFRKNTELKSVEIDSVQLVKGNDGRSLLSMRINRAGTRSTFGGIIVMGVSQGKPISLSHLSGNALYAETSEKKITIPLVTDELDYDASGKTPITITYINEEEGVPQEPLCEWKGVL